MNTGRPFWINLLAAASVLLAMGFCVLARMPRAMPVLIVLEAALISAAVLLARRESLDTSFAFLAQKYGGAVTSRGLIFGLPAARVYARGVHVEVAVRGRWPKRYTEVRIPWQTPLDCELVSGISRWQAVSPKERTFEATFSLEGEPYDLLEGFRTPRAKGQLIRLRDKLGQSRLQVAVTGETLIVRKPDVFSKHELREFVEMSVDLFETVRNYEQAPADEAMAIVTAEQKPAEPGVCQVCGEVIAGQEVRCSRCHSPHHLECWNYNGECSIYACGSKQYYEVDTPAP